MNIMNFLSSTYSAVCLLSHIVGLAKGTGAATSAPTLPPIPSALNCSKEFNFEHQFRCASGGNLCVYPWRECDGKADCPDESDEANCQTCSGKFRCRNGGTCTDGEDDQYFTCKCAKGWKGPTCEKIQTKGIRDHKALGAAVVAVLIPGLVIFTLIFICCFFCCYWRKIPFLRRQFSKSSQGRSKPKKIPAGAYPHQVRYTPGQQGDAPDSGGIVPQQAEVRIHVEPATETDNREQSEDSNYGSGEGGGGEGENKQEKEEDEKQKQEEAEKEPLTDSKEAEASPKEAEASQEAEA